MKKIARHITPEMQTILEHNGIDWRRVAKCKISHSATGVVTMITVKLYALDPNEESDPLATHEGVTT